MTTTTLSALKTDPTKILTSNEQSSSDILQLLKTIVDPILSTTDNNVLEELFVDGLDASQVWPQVKMVLDSVIEELSFDKIPKLSAQKTPELNESYENDDSEQEETFTNKQSRKYDNYDDDEEEEEKEAEMEDSDDSIDMTNLQDDYEESDISDNDDDQKTLVDSDKETITNPKTNSELDDGFFNIEEFNKQILSLEKQANGEYDDDDDADDDEEIDYFNDIPESDDEEILYFQDFFNKPQENAEDEQKGSDVEQKINEDEDEDQDIDEEEFDEEDFNKGLSSAMKDMFGDEDDEEDIKMTANLSSFERQQLEIQKEIAKLEKEAITEKKWALKGESKAKERPADALLQEELEFERTAKPVPVITKEITESLEEMIRRRIKEGNFDDLPKRTIDDLNNFKKSRRFELSEEKSQKSLAELYEDDFKGNNTDAVSDELTKSHDEIKELFKSLSHKLDALSSAHFIPKPMKKALDIKVEASAISMEDATPLSLSGASRLAPQEVYKSGRSNDKKSKNKDEIELRSGVVIARSELDREEKQRLRRANKRKRSKEFSVDAMNSAKKSKKQDAIDTLNKANNVTIIDNKGEKRDVKGNLVKEGGKKGSSQFRL